VIRWTTNDVKQNRWHCYAAGRAGKRHNYRLAFASSSSFSAARCRHVLGLRRDLNAAFVGSQQSFVSRPASCETTQQASTRSPAARANGGDRQLLSDAALAKRCVQEEKINVHERKSHRLTSFSSCHRRMPARRRQDQRRRSSFPSQSLRYLRSRNIGRVNRSSICCARLIQSSRVVDGSFAAVWERLLLSPCCSSKSEDLTYDSRRVRCRTHMHFQV
jgi:hypothetical protein